MLLHLSSKFIYFLGFAFFSASAKRIDVVTGDYLKKELVCTDPNVDGCYEKTSFVGNYLMFIDDLESPIEPVSYTYTDNDGHKCMDLIKAQPSSY